MSQLEKFTFIIQVWPIFVVLAVLYGLLNRKHYIIFDWVAAVATRKWLLIYHGAWFTSWGFHYRGQKGYLWQLLGSVVALLGGALLFNSAAEGLMGLGLEGLLAIPTLLGGLGGGSTTRQDFLNCTEWFPRLAQWGSLRGTTRKLLASRARFLHFSGVERRSVWASFAEWDAVIPAKGAQEGGDFILPSLGLLQLRFNWLAAHTAAVQYSQLHGGLTFHYSILCYDWKTLRYYLHFYGTGVSYPQPQAPRQPLADFEDWLLEDASPAWVELEVVGFGTLFHNPSDPTYMAEG
jgi:hypothetical protein